MCIVSLIHRICWFAMSLCSHLFRCLVHQAHEGIMTHTKRYTKDVNDNDIDVCICVFAPITCNGAMHACVRLCQVYGTFKCIVVLIIRICAISLSMCA